MLPSSPIASTSAVSAACHKLDSATNTVLHPLILGCLRVVIRWNIPRVYLFVTLHSPTSCHAGFRLLIRFLWQLVDVFLIHEDLNLVFEFCETDLESILMEQSVILKPAHVKCHMQMLLEGINYLHVNFVLHRVRIT